MKSIEIQPGLWIGDEKAACNKNFIQSNNIQIRINCNQYLNYSSHKYKSPVKEKIVANEVRHTIQFFEKITQYMYRNLKNFNNLFIYCHNDLHISISVIIAFLMRYGKMTKACAVHLLKSKIPKMVIADVSNQSLDVFDKILLKKVS